MSSLSFCQSLVLQQQCQLSVLLHEANRELDQKAVSFLQAGLAVTALGVLGVLMADLSGWVLGSGFGLFMLMVLLSISALSPKANQFPGQADWDKVRTKYIQVDDQSCFDQILSDMIEASKMVEVINSQKASTVKWSGVVFIGQVFFLLVMFMVISL